MSHKVLVSFDLDDPVDTRTVMDLITKHIGEMQHQQKLSVGSPKKMGGEENPPSVFVPATDKQRAYMTRLGIVWTEKTSVKDATILIDERVKSFKKGGEGRDGEKNPL